MADAHIATSDAELRRRRWYELTKALADELGERNRCWPLVRAVTDALETQSAIPPPNGHHYQLSHNQALERVAELERELAEAVEFGKITEDRLREASLAQSATTSREAEAVALLERCLPNLHGGSWAHMTNGPCDCKKCIREAVAAFLHATDRYNREDK